MSSQSDVPWGETPPRYLRITGDRLAPDLGAGDYVGLVPVKGFCQPGLYLVQLGALPTLYGCRSNGEGGIA